MSEMFKALIVGDEQFKRVLEGIGRFAKRPRLAMQDMAAELEEQTEDNFAAEGRPKWKELSDATKLNRIGGKKGLKKNGELKARSKRILDNLKILQDSGALAASVHSQYGDDYSMIGAARPYARIQQLGGQAGRGLKVTLPSRPYLPFSADGTLQKEAEQELLKIGMEHLRRSAE